MDDEKFINLAIKASHLKMQEEVTELLRKAYEEEKNLEQEQTERKVHMPSQIDMHMHSTSSDGKDTPAQLWEKIKALGIKTFALTDHDAIDGVKDMEHLVSSEKDGSARFIRGIEFSCKTQVGKCHILGYRYDWHNEFFISILAKGAALRSQKL